MAKIKANDALVKELYKWQIDHVYGIPGDSIDLVVDALKKAENEMTFYHVRHEEVATLAASSYAKLTGKIAVALGIGGPGSIHLLNGMYDAKLDNVPMLVLAGQVDSDKIGTKFFQEVDLPSLFENVAVYNKQLDSAENVYEFVNEAIQTAYAEKGVAVLTIPSDILDNKIEEKVSKGNYTIEEQRQEIVASDMEEAASLIKKSEKPVALVGAGAKGAQEALIQFLEHANIPAVITLPAKGVVPDTHPNYMGNLGQVGTKSAFEAMQDADLLIMIGNNYPYENYLPKENIPCIQVDIDATNIGKRFNTSVGIVADAADALSALTDATESVSDRPFLNACRENMRTWNSWMQEDKEDTSKPIHPERLMAEIEKISEPDTIFSVDVGTSTVWATRYLELNHSQDFLISSWLGTMGCGLPGSIASKIAEPERQAICITGDGGFSMVMQDFVTAVKYDLPIIVVVLNNEELSFIKYEQQSSGELEYGIDLGDIDYAAFAKASNGVGYTVTEPEQLGPTLEEARDANKPVIVNVLVDPEAAPLPGKIVWDEAKGYAKFEMRSVLEENKFKKMPPLKTVMRRFF